MSPSYFYIYCLFPDLNWRHILLTATPLKRDRNNNHGNQHMRLTTLTYLLALFSSALSPAFAGETEDFIAKLNEHYKATKPIKTFSLRYHFLNNQYRENDYWDFRSPNRVMSQRMVEVDMEKKHFYDNDILYGLGGRLFDRAQFQNDEHSFYYEKSASTYGKAYINQGLGNYDRFIHWMIKNVDFLVVRPLLQEGMISKNISLKHNEADKTSTLSHRQTDGNTIEYKFKTEPLQLISVYDTAAKYLTTYQDYQTTRGLTFARAVNSYTHGLAEPAYIKYIDDFSVINQVTPERLKLPAGYGPEVQRGDGILTLNEIGKDLFLITDSSAVINSLAKVNGDKITLFGASTYARLAEKIIALMTKHFPTKKLHSVYVSHPHISQIAGLEIYAAHGINVLADEYTIAGIKAYSPFSATIDSFVFTTISHGQTIDNTNFYILDNLHSKKQGFVHFQDNEIIFQSHFLHIPKDNTIARVIPNYSKVFIDFIRENKITFNRIVGNYRNNKITVEVVNKTYKAFM